MPKYLPLSYRNFSYTKIKNGAEQDTGTHETLLAHSEHEATKY